MECRGQLWDKAPVFRGHREERRARRLIFMSFDSGIYLEQRVRGGFLPFYAESGGKEKFNGRQKKTGAGRIGKRKGTTRKSNLQRNIYKRY
jgi:hypothetical protein